MSSPARRHLDWFSGFAGFTVVTNTHTDRPRHIGNNRPHLTLFVWCGYLRRVAAQPTARDRMTLSASLRWRRRDDTGNAIQCLCVEVACWWPGGDCAPSGPTSIASRTTYQMLDARRSNPLYISKLFWPNPTHRRLVARPNVWYSLAARNLVSASIWEGVTILVSVSVWASFNITTRTTYYATTTGQRDRSSTPSI